MSNQYKGDSTGSHISLALPATARALDKYLTTDPDNIITVFFDKPEPVDLVPEEPLIHLHEAFVFLSDSSQNSASDEVESAIAFIGQFFQDYPSDPCAWHDLLSAPFLADLPNNIHSLIVMDDSQFLLTGLWTATALVRAAHFPESSELLASPLGCYLRHKSFLCGGPFWTERVRLAIRAVRLQEEDFGRLLHYGVKRSLSGFLPSKFAGRIRHLLRSYWTCRVVRVGTVFYQTQHWFAVSLVSAIVERHIAGGDFPDAEFRASCRAKFAALLMLGRCFDAAHADLLIKRAPMMEWVEFLLDQYADATNEERLGVIVLLRKCLQCVWLWYRSDQLRELFLAVGPPIVAFVQHTDHPEREDGLLFLVILMRRGAYRVDDYGLFREALSEIADDMGGFGRASMCLLRDLAAYWFEVDMEDDESREELGEMCAWLSEALRSN
jgi:hypothetical protein